MSIPRAVLDCDVIVSRVLYELLGRAAVDGKLLTLLWSDELLAEARHALIDSKGVPEAAAEHWVGHLRREFPAGRVDIGEASSDVDLSSLTRDPGDEHVCALAIAGQADLLFTFDRGYLQQPLQAHGIEVTRPDPFLAAAIERDAELFRRLLADQAAVWGGGKPVHELVDALDRARAPRFAEKARALLSSEEPGGAAS